jgi:hypothetical protein
MQNFSVGDIVYFWTGRGSHGYGTIVRITNDRIFLNPEPDAQKGSDYRVLKSGAEWWMPRNTGILHDQIDTPPKFWYRNF